MRLVFDDDGAVVDPAEFLAAWRRPHVSVCRADLYLAGQLIQPNLPVTAGRVTSNGLAGVRSRCSGVTIPLRELDVRLDVTGWELRLLRGVLIPGSNAVATFTDYITGGGDYLTGGGQFLVIGDELTAFGTDIADRNLWTSLGVFAIQDVRVDDSDGGAVTVIDGEDLFRKVSDARLLSSVRWTTSDSLVTVAEQMLQGGVPYLTMQSSGAAGNASAIVHEADTDRLEATKEAARSVGAELFMRDFTAVWRPEPDLAFAVPVVDIIEGETWVNGQVELSRRESFNAWPVLGTNPDEDSAESEVYAVAYDDDPQSITYWSGPFGQKPAPVMRSDQIDTQDKAIAAAEAEKLKNKGRARAITAASWPCPLLEPGDAVTLLRGVLGVDEIALLDEVDMGLTALDKMNVTCRTRQVAS